MPLDKRIRRRYYGVHWYKQVRPPILLRAGGRFDERGKYLGGARCEQCGKPDRQTVYVWRSQSCGQYWTLSLVLQDWHYCAMGGAQGSFRLFGKQIRQASKIKVFIQVCHLNHVRGDDRPPNLKALCGWCHTNYDKLQHKQTREEHKDARRPLLSRHERLDLNRPILALATKL